MITNNGKELISKFLLGQAPSYGTHLAIGCGALPLDSNDIAPAASVLAQKEVLDFEMARVPITSKGFVDDDGITKVALTAELPNENRYDITEVGLWSQGRNSLASGFDSYTIFTFTESWQGHNTSIFELPIPSPLGSAGNITTTDQVFIASNNDAVFQNTTRKNRKEGPRFLNSSILLRGDSSIIHGASANWTGSDLIYQITNKALTSSVATLTTSENHLLNVNDSILVNVNDANFDGTYTITARTNNTFNYVRNLSNITSASASGNVTYSNSTHIHLNGISLNTTQNSPADTIKLAFSLIDKDAVGNGDPDYVKILIEFYRNEVSTTSGYAKAEIYLPGSAFTNKRYQIVDIPISSLVTSPDFSAANIRICRIFASVIYTDSGQQKRSTNHYVLLDGLRLENTQTQNPLYKLVGYSVVRTDDGKPITKFTNTNNYIEFRFNLGVG
jgi:hypothetical protein